MTEKEIVIKKFENSAITTVTRISDDEYMLYFDNEYSMKVWLTPQNGFNGRSLVVFRVCHNNDVKTFDGHVEFDKHSDFGRKLFKSVEDFIEAKRMAAIESRKKAEEKKANNLAKFLSL